MPDYFICNDREIDYPQNISNEFHSYFENFCKIASDSMPSQAASNSSSGSFNTFENLT